MAQAEDTELRDLVIEALEKNGSLAKIRALLRANIFLAFEDECENIKHNLHLDNILKLPEGLLALSIVHEFLEFCNLKNTLFVYMSESRQGKEYKCDGKKLLLDKLNFPKQETIKEPLLTIIIKHLLQLQQHKSQEPSESDSLRRSEKVNGSNFRDDQNNCTYIVHEDSQSSTTGSSQSDNSSDEKNKLHLRLHLDNSDTDTSSDSARDKNCSEYIPNDHIKNGNKINSQHSSDSREGKSPNIAAVKFKPEQNTLSYYMNELKQTTNSSTDSTSYLDLKPYTTLDEKMLNTAGVPIQEVDENSTSSHVKQPTLNVTDQQNNHSPQSTTSNISSLSPKTDSESKNLKICHSKSPRIMEQGSVKSDLEDYSNDFTTSQISRNRDNSNNKQLLECVQVSSAKHSPLESPHQISPNSQSSVSISDVADLISEKSISFSQPTNHDKIHDSKATYSGRHKSKSEDWKRSHSDDSGEFTESPIPSLSNLSLDIHSD